MQEKEKVGQDVQQDEQSGDQPQNALGREMEGEGMSSNYSGMGNLNPNDLTTGDHATGETATMTTPGSSKTDDGASEGHRIADEDNRQ
ncbi:hypothetical protein GCM10017783_23340 [Deinococcus piscis]|uniref:Uncharacterized protein n=2 Tax=Deinococcus piscis TaxID=394230 RepID=A0ABQ3KAD7_9DEIO|nr:hypothetical protein GCM10017783_23340 [Deinococcus piscis]